MLYLKPCYKGQFYKEVCILLLRLVHGKTYKTLCTASKDTYMCTHASICIMPAFSICCCYTISNIVWSKHWSCSSECTEAQLPCNIVILTGMIYSSCFTDYKQNYHSCKIVYISFPGSSASRYTHSVRISYR